MSKEYSKETQQNKKLQHYNDKVSKFVPQDNIKNIKSKEEANSGVSVIGRDRGKIGGKMPMDSKKKVTGKNTKPCGVKDVRKIRKEEMNFENPNIENKADPSEGVMNRSSYERDQINLYNDLSGTRKDINIGGFDKEKSSEKSSIFTNGDFKINTNNNDIRKTANNIESNSLKYMKDIKKESESSSNRNHENSPLFSGVNKDLKMNNKGNLFIERGINNFDNINNTGLEIYDHNKSVDINIEEIKNINSQSSIYNINNNNDDKNKNINNNNNIKHLKNELLKTNANKDTINNINKNVINNINRNNNLNNNIINEIDNNIAGYSHNEFNILIKNIENTNQINFNLATKISDLVKKIDESNTNTKELVKKIDESNNNTKDLVKTIDKSNTNVAALVKQNQTIINALIHGNSKSLNPNENTEGKNHS